MTPSEVFKMLFGELADDLILEDVDSKTCIVKTKDGSSFPFEVHP